MIGGKIKQARMKCGVLTTIFCLNPGAQAQGHCTDLWAASPSGLRFCSEKCNKDGHIATVSSWGW